MVVLEEKTIQYRVDSHFVEIPNGKHVCKIFSFLFIKQNKFFACNLADYYYEINGGKEEAALEYIIFHRISPKEME